MSEQGNPGGIQGTEDNDPLGMSKFSPRRNTVKIIICLGLIIALLASATIQAAITGGAQAAAIPFAGLTVSVIMICILVQVSIRTVQGEIWIRRMGMGDLEYRVEPTGSDEIAKALEALETLRQSSLRAMQLDRVQQLSEELQEKNQELERTLEELRIAQDSMVSQQKLAELGELAAGVAHEIRNPLNFVRNYADASATLTSLLTETMAQERSQENLEEIDELASDLSKNMERIAHHCERANRIVTAMLGMSQQGQGEFSNIPVNQLVREQAQLAHQAARAQDPYLNTDVRYDLDPNAGEIEGVYQELGRVVINLVSNSCQAIASRLEQDQNHEPALRLTTKREPGQVSIEVWDNGTGMNEETMKKMFNPFFTTKDANQGTGLGLSLCFDIVRKHRGELTAESEEGNYTRMTMTLPTGPDKPATEPDDQENRSNGGTGR